VRFENFSILGGPFYALVAGRVPFNRPAGLAAAGLYLGLFLWGILVLLALIEGAAGRLFSMGTLAIHARLLAALPLILWCEVTLDRAIRGCCASLVHSKIVSGEALAALDADAAFLAKLRDSWLITAALLLIAGSVSFLSPSDFLLAFPDSAGATQPGAAPLAILWHWAICLPIFRLVALRFVFVFALWVIMIWRLSRQTLQLVATHPDLAGGLGLIEDVQKRLTTIVMVISIINSASLAAAFQIAPVDINQIYLYMLVITLLGMVIVSGPLFLLALPLARCRRKGMLEFSDVTLLYARLFDEKWVRPPTMKQEELLGSPDIQSLADISSAFMNVKMMRIILISKELVTSVALYAAVPLAPLFLFVYRVDELLPKIIGNLLGL